MRERDGHTDSEERGEYESDRGREESHTENNGFNIVYYILSFLSLYINKVISSRISLFLHSNSTNHWGHGVTFGAVGRIDIRWYSIRVHVHVARHVARRQGRQL